MRRKQRTPVVAVTSSLALASGMIGALAATGSALPQVRGLGAMWLQIVAAGLARNRGTAPIDASFSALYVLPFLVMLFCCLLAIGLGLVAHAKAGLEAHTRDAQRSAMATFGILAGSIGLWLLLHT